MAVLFGKFEMPEKITVDENGHTSASFVAEPFERGLGHTIGNALRRIMLNSLEAPAINSICIEGVPHEYMAVEGIVEDMINIVLNFKGTLLRKLHTDENSYSSRSHTISKILNITEDDLKETGQYRVTVKDLMDDGYFEVVNPDHHLFTITAPMTRRVDIKISIGRGYLPAERHEVENKVMGEISIDSIFSPVTLVRYHVENTRVGQDTEYDRLILDIKTDGRITPKEALTFAAQICIKHFDVFKQVEAYMIKFEEISEEKDTDRDEMLRKLSLRINEIELSVRSTNCLSSANIQTIGELVVKPEPEMLRYRNFGKKSLNEIKDKLYEMGLSLGMDLSRYGITQDNVLDVLKDYEEEQMDM